MIRRLIRDSAIYSVAKILYAGLPILLVPICTNFIAPNQFGVYELFALLGMLANVGVAFEISQGFARTLADANDYDERRSIAGTALLFTLGCYAVFFTLSVALAGPLTTLVAGDPEWSRAFVAAAASCTATGVFIFFQQLLRWRLRPDAFTWSTLLFVAATVGLSLLLLSWRADVTSVFTAQAIAATLASGSALWFGRSYVAFRFSVAQCREMLVFSIPLVPSSLSVFVFNYADRYLLRRYSGLEDVAVYSVGFRYAAISTMLLLGIQPALTPLIYRDHDKPATPAALARIFGGLCAITIPLVVALTLFAPLGLRLLGTGDYLRAASVVPLLAASTLLARIYVFAPGLHLAKKTGVVALVNVAAAILNVVLGVLWIPSYGLLGAAVSTLMSSAIICVAHFAFSQAHYPVPYPYARILLATSVGVVGIVGTQYFQVAWVGRTVVLLLVALVASETLELRTALTELLRARRRRNAAKFTQ